MKLLASLAAFAVLAFSACAHAQPPQNPVGQNPVGPTDELTIVSGDKSHAFKVELADTPQESEMGLMHRPSMPRDHGMIFDFGRPTETTMWMKNTLIPLDMVFSAPDGKVLRIETHTEPFSTKIIPSEGTFSAVLELNAGQADKIGLKRGDKVIYPGLAPAP
jgi:uncharacterized membrane protein (UPF0127 family)